jgi:hypothetical protein
VLEGERGRQAPIPPPVSEDHAALRERMEEAVQTFRNAESYEGFDYATGLSSNPVVLRAAVRFLEMIDEERELLEEHGVEWRPYQP